MSPFSNQIPSSRESQFQKTELLHPVSEHWEVLWFSGSSALKIYALKALNSTVFVGGAEEFP